MKLGLKIATFISISLPVATAIWVWYGIPSHPQRSCIHVSIDYGDYGVIRPAGNCMPAFEPTDAFSFLMKYGIDVQGTISHGLAEVCRVNTIPGLYTALYKVAGHEKYIERCHTTPPSFAHWVTFVKTVQHDKVPAKDWTQTTLPLYAIVLQPGDYLGLAYETNGHYNHPRDYWTSK
jgi:hypothetical protein